MAQSILKGKVKSSRSTSIPVNFLILWEQYLEHCRAFNSKEWFNAKRYIADRYFAKWYDREIHSLRPAEIEKHLIERRSLSARSANLDLEIIRHFFNWCVQMDYLVKSPLGPIRRFPVGKTIKPIPTRNDIDNLIQANEGQDRLLILLLVYTMGRYSEVRRLKWEDVDLDKQVLYLRTRKTRDGSEKIREIPINGPLLQVLSSLRKEEGPVLQSPVTGEAYRDLRRALQRCLRKSGIATPNMGFHAFRHYGATMLADAGVPLNVIQDLLGHTSLGTTNLYLQSLRESKRKAMEVL
jgi:integrase